MASNVFYRIILCSGVIFCSATLVAAQDSCAYRQDIAYVRQSEAWLHSENASGLQHVAASNISSAGIYFVKNNGEYVNYHQSDNSYEMGALTESFFRINPRIVFYGKVHYSNFTGQNMGGSTFINPYYNAFDIVEFSDTTRGAKNLERYHLVGAVSARLVKGLSLGGKLDYTAANYAKYKDLRHTNTFFDLTATAGLSYRIGSVAEVGAGYYYRRSIEGITFAVYGNTDRQYTSLINFGMFYGRTELFSTSASVGYTNSSGMLPVVNTFNGWSVQANLKPAKHWSFFNEFAYKTRKGYYGTRSTTSPVYVEHEGTYRTYTGALSFKKRHTLQLHVEREQLDNFENIFEQSNSATGGRHEIVYYGNNKVLDRKTRRLRAAYTAQLGAAGGYPAWTLHAAGGSLLRQQTVSLYPFYRMQEVRYYEGALLAGRNIARRRSIYSLTLGVSYGSGRGTEKYDGTYVAVPESQRPPKSSDANLKREYEYLTAAHVGGNVGLQYAFPLRYAKHGYVRADGALTGVPDGYFKSQQYATATLTVGCNF
ncbi:MAG: hypothetical protein LBT48_07740 [Prevotellaceae bacterium]|jgi:hypothetical protein|nr:hypothetical protein [Prevotellaceae bacterium]